MTKITKRFNLLKNRIKAVIYSVKCLGQRIFQPNHISDMEMWSLDLTISEWVYPRLLNFISTKRIHYPCFIDIPFYHDTNSDNSKYDDLLNYTKTLGNGYEAWEKILQEMLFAFEWKIRYNHCENEIQHNAFCKKET